MTSRELTLPADTGTVAEPGEPASAIATALAVNVTVATLKAAAWWFTGSPAMLAEAAHSAVNGGSQVMMLGGRWHSRYRPRARYGWALAAAVNMFAAGGVYATYEGLSTILSGETTEGLMWVALVVLAVAAAGDGLSWWRAMRALSATRGARSWRAHLRDTPDTDIAAVLLEDTADLAGVVLAATGLLLRMATGSAVADGVASVLIGCLLTVMAWQLAARNVRLLGDTRELVEVCV